MVNYRRMSKEASRRAAQVARERRMAKFAAAVKGHDIRGICRCDIWGEWEYQGCPQISAEWIRDLVANRYVQFVFEDLSTFNQLKASSDKKWVKPRLYPDTFLNDNWYYTGLRSLD